METYQKRNLRCSICGNTEDNKLYKVQERQLNQGDFFQYLYCPQCGTLQLYEEVENLSQYYQDNYYSFNVKARRKKSLPMFIKKSCSKLIVNCPFMLPSLMENFLRDKMGSLFLLYGTKVKLASAILDVGGGNGKWLDILSQWGFSNLTCIDLFCKRSPYPAINFLQKDLQNMPDIKQYDCITFHHSFEHMAEPRRILAKVKKLLSPDGICLIRIPVCECEAWNRYKEYWYQIDAPRHYFLYTERALRALCGEFDLEIFKVIYDSGLTQFINSEYYQNTDLSLKEIQEKTKSQRESFRKTRNLLNKTGKGDQAAFYIRHMPKTTDKD